MSHYPRYTRLKYRLSGRRGQRIMPASEYAHNRAGCIATATGPVSRSDDRGGSPAIRAGVALDADLTRRIGRHLRGNDEQECVISCGVTSVTARLQHRAAPAPCAWALGVQSQLGVDAGDFDADGDEVYSSPSDGTGQYLYVRRDGAVRGTRLSPASGRRLSTNGLREPRGGCRERRLVDVLA